MASRCQAVVRPAGVSQKRPTNMIELLALGSAVLYGSADFFGGLTARRANTIATVFVSQAVGLVLLLLVLPFLPAASVSSRDWIWGFVAGLSGGIGVALLYRALAVGSMAVVAPTTAVIAAMIPVLFGFALGERLRLLTWSGVGPGARRHRVWSAARLPRTIQRPGTENACVAARFRPRPALRCRRRHFLSLARAHDHGRGNVAAGGCANRHARFVWLDCFLHRSNSLDEPRSRGHRSHWRRARYGGERLIYDRRPDRPAQHCRYAGLALSREHGAPRARGPRRTPERGADRSASSARSALSSSLSGATG